MGDDQSRSEADSNQEDSHAVDVDAEADWSDETDPVAPGGFLGYSNRTILEGLGVAFLLAVVMEFGKAVGQRLAPPRF